MEDRLILKKVLYAKRVPTTTDQVKAILILDIETHLRNNPDLQFLKIGEPTLNDDRSKTIPIHFCMKSHVPTK